ncbi:MAG: hypothetical protein ABSG62_00615 [Terracidiphilus sp.]|jgi:hypothetical protein
MTDEDPQEPYGATSGAGQQAPQGEKKDEDQTDPGAQTADAEQQNPIGAIADSPQQGSAVEPSKPAANPTYVYAAIGAGLGILVGVAFAAVAWGPAGSHAPFDLGSVVSYADGLKGHLILNWGKKLKYHLVVEPSDPGKHAEFSLAASSPPRPLAFDIQLKDPAGSVLCSKTIVLKYDPRQAAALAPSDKEPKAGTASAGKVSTDQIAQAIDIARSEALELQREHGQDIFQNNIGQDGQIQSISSQGDMPCSRQAYERIAFWSFSQDFPTLDEQAELLNRQANAHADRNPSPPGTSAAATASGARKASATRKKAKKNAPEEPATFAIEGDDELVMYDPSRGIIQTIARKTFLIDKTGGEGNAARWQDTPANIHYKCDLTAICTLTRAGAVALHARLRR